MVAERERRATVDADDFEHAVAAQQPLVRGRDERLGRRRDVTVEAGQLAHASQPTACGGFGRVISEAFRVAWVYLLRCADNSLYCGWTTDPDRRLRQHRAGTASKYTKRRLPVEYAL